MLYSRAAIYFDEVVKCGSIRRASETLNIAASAIDRQIIQLERSVGAPLFERIPKGLRLTAAGETLIGAVRRWRQDYQRVQATIDDLQGLRRGSVSIAAVEGAKEILTKAIGGFHARYPYIDYHVRVMGSSAVVEAVATHAVEMGLTFNPPMNQALHIDKTLIYQLGVVVPPDHNIAGLREIAIRDCVDHRLVIPDESISLRLIIDDVWCRCLGTPIRGAVTANSICMLKSFIKGGLGVGMLTQIDVLDEIRSGELRFIPLADADVPVSVLSIISDSGRGLSVPASLVLQHLSASMMQESVPAD